jgi:hypothetical protein
MAIRTIQQLLDKFGPGDSPRSSDYVDLIETLADDRNAVYFSTTAPADVAANPIWFKTDTNGLFVYSNGQWVASGGGGAADLSGYATENYVDTAEAAAISTASADATTKANAAQTAAEDYADGLATNYDVSGAAATAESNSNTYTDDLIGDATVDGTAGNTVIDRISTAVSGLVDSAPAALDTLNELAAALGDDENFATTITGALGNKQDKVANVSDTEIGYLDGVTSAIQTQINGKAASSHSHAQSDITNLTTDLAAKASLSGSETLTNKRINPRSATLSNGATITIAADSTDFYSVTALAQSTTFASPTGTPVDGQKLTVRVKDDGTARSISWNSIFRGSADLALPTITLASKTMYLGFVYNSADSKWDMVARLGNF